jgi:two-component system, LuxR family, response regulator DctR
MTQATVYIVDDDEAIRDSFQWLLDGYQLKSLPFGSAADFERGLDAPLAAPACILLDVRMPDKSGLEVFDGLKARAVATPVVFITGHGDVAMAVDAVKRGAFDFIEKPVNEKKLIDTIQAALAMDASQQEAKQMQNAVADRFAQLTPRERDVMRLVIAGKLNKTIADQLNISIKTVEIHRSRVMEKTGAKSLAELVQLAMKANE